MSVEDQAVTNPVDTIPATTEEEQLGLDAQEDPPESKNRDRTHPLNHPSQEMLAQFLAAPMPARFPFCHRSGRASEDFPNDHLSLGETPHVMRRIEHLSMQNKVLGDLFVRREWLPIMQKAVEKAKGGDVSAMRFCADCALPKIREGPGLSLIEILRMTENEGESPAIALEYRAAQISSSNLMRHRKTKACPNQLARLRGVGDSLSQNPVASRRFDPRFREAQLIVEPVTEAQARIAREAYRDFGKGSGHPAGLNFGNCFAYTRMFVSTKSLSLM